MKVQIYITDPRDVRICEDAGVNFIGMVADNKMKTPSSISYEEVRKTFKTIPRSLMKVGLTLEKTAAENFELIDTIDPDILHFGLDLREITETVYDKIKREYPYLKLLGAIGMNSKDPLLLASTYSGYFDFFILDTNDPNKVDLGATGITHDWNLSAKLTNQVNIPVILAGGLSHENVKKAIRTVKPWGVDSFSKTNIDGTLRKDPDKVQKFVTFAKSIF